MLDFPFSIKYTQLNGKKSHIPQQIIRIPISIRNNIIYEQCHETWIHANRENKVFLNALLMHVFLISYP